MNEFSNINQQIDILKSSGIKFNNISHAKNVLKRVNYYNIINTFKDLFINSENSIEYYIDNIT